MNLQRRYSRDLIDSSFWGLMQYCIRNSDNLEADILAKGKELNCTLQYTVFPTLGRKICSIGYFILPFSVQSIHLILHGNKWWKKNCIEIRQRASFLQVQEISLQKLNCNSYQRIASALEVKKSGDKGTCIMATH